MCCPPDPSLRLKGGFAGDDAIKRRPNSNEASRVRDEWHEAAQFAKLDSYPPIPLLYQLQLLRIFAANWDNHASIFGKLGYKCGRQFRRGGRHHDRVVRSGFRKTSASVANDHADILVSHSGQPLPPGVGETGMTFDGNNFRCQFGQERADVARAGSNFEYAVAGTKGERVQHAGHYVRLRDRLAFANGQRMIFVRLTAVAFGSKCVARDAFHRSKDAFIADAARAQLHFHHAHALHRKQRSIGSGFHTREHGSRIILFLAAANAHIEADHAVLITRAHNGDVAVDVILALNDLLRTL